jgi:putative addiction module component (TIGR02574 family)
MSARVDTIFQEVMLLSDEERIELCDRLFFSLSPEQQADIDKSWSEEAQRRMEAYRNGEVEALDLKEVLVALKHGMRP